MQIVFDFISGGIPFEEFWNAYCKNPEIGQWLDGIADFSQDPPPQIRKDLMLTGLYLTVKKQYNGHIKPYIIEDYEKEKLRLNDVIYRYCFYSVIETAVITAFPNAKRTNIYKDDENYFYKALGRSIGGSEVMAYASEILNRFPRTMKKADRAAAGKAAIQEAFHIHDRKFPCWPQEADWPMGKNSPMEYLGRHKDGELVQLRFRDVDTGEERIVEQFY